MNYHFMKANTGYGVNGIHSLVLLSKRKYPVKIFLILTFNSPKYFDGKHVYMLVKAP